VFSNILVGGIGPTLSSVKYNFYPVVALVKLLYGDFEEPPVWFIEAICLPNES